MRRVLGCVGWCWWVGLGSSVGYEEGFWDVRVVLGVGARWWRMGRGRRGGVDGDGAAIDEIVPEMRVVGVLGPGVEVSVVFGVGNNLEEVVDDGSFCGEARASV